MKSRAEGVAEQEYEELVRHADKAFDVEARAKQPRVKEAIVVEREYLNIRLKSEDVAEFEYKPSSTKKSYRIVVVRKNLAEERGQLLLCERVRYFFYVTNDRAMSKEEVVAEANQRCNQENLIAQLKDGVRALHSPLNTLEANWAYMVMVALAWSLKAWPALLLPTSPRWADKYEAEREEVLRMEFRTFLNNFMLVPAQIVRTGRRLVFRLLAWRPRLHILFDCSCAL
ncbi:MAG: transposase [Deltaproteobacteria bacterium]|nr:transposase [Deltaproteobacteria bacterium]